MIALILLVVVAVCLGLYVLAVWLTVRWAKRTGRSAKRWGFGAAIGLYLLVFWDQIPTFALHHYYCATEAGVWVYKTPEQWKAENPGVAETLTWKDLPDEFRNETHSWFVLNERFHWVMTGKSNPIFPVWRPLHTIVDVKTGDIVVKEISVNSGYPGSSWHLRKAFVGCDLCNPGGKIFNEYEDKFNKLGRNIK